VRLLILGIMTVPLGGQFLRLEIQLGEMSCASCAESLPGRLKKIRGVERIEMDKPRALVRIELAEGNRARLEQIRDFIQQDGTLLESARVKVRGAILKLEDRWLLRPAGSERTYELLFPAGQQPRAEGDFVGEGIFPDAKFATMRLTSVSPAPR